MMLTGTIDHWKRAYAQGATPAQILAEQLAACDAQDPAWITLATPRLLEQQLDALARYAANEGQESLPLFGVPFAVKDNIDVAGFPTTAACPAFAYTAQSDATAVAKLKQAGAIVIGKTNLDQFATGLVGTRSPYGAVPNVFVSHLVSGGSSSGSASVVARGLVPFALSTDTAGSGRIPAAFNQLVGLKPTPGAVSNAGVVPACKTLDCVGVLACTVEDAATALTVMEGLDPLDCYSKPRPMAAPHQPLASLKVAIPQQRLLDENYAAAFSTYVNALATQVTGVGAIDFEPLFEVAALLYQGPWVAERALGAQRILAQHPQQLLPVIREILEAAEHFSAADAFAAQYRLQALKQKAERIWNDWDVLCVPTAPRHPSIDEVQSAPITVNAELGLYTNFVNLLGWCAVAIPANTLPNGLPFGVTLIAPAWHEPDLVRWAQQLARSANLPAGTTALRPSDSRRVDINWSIPAHPPVTKLAVVGAHMRGMPLNHELLACGARFLEATYSAPRYRLYALPNTDLPKPGLARVADDDSESFSIALEIWELPTHNLGAFMANITAPLGIGNVTLASGEVVKGFICEAHALNSALDISHFGGWRAYINSK